MQLYCVYAIINSAVLHGELQSLDRKLTPGAEPVVRVWRAG